MIAERDGAAVGFALGLDPRSDWFLASLFVTPAAQARGTGSALLDAVWGETAGPRRTLTDAIQPVSNALYGRRGLTPVTPVLAFAGVGAPGERRSRRLDGAADELRLGEIDRAAYGFDRAPDHAYWRPRARASVWVRDGEPVAYSYAWPGGAIGPVAGLDPVAAAGALAGELALAGGAVTVRIPGSSRLLVGLVLARGLRLSPTPGLLLVSGEAPPPDALAIGSYALF